MPDPNLHQGPETVENRSHRSNPKLDPYSRVHGLTKHKHGATEDDMRYFLGMKRDDVRAVIKDLLGRQMIKDSGKKRLSRKFKFQILWVASDHPELFPTGRQTRTARP